MTTTEEPERLSRRGMLTGLGAVGGAVLLGKAAAADAAPPTPTSPRANAGITPDSAAPGLTSIASAPIAGVQYQYRSWTDLTNDFNPTNGRASGSNGVYPNVGTDFLATTFDITPGAIFYDVEWYVANESAVDSEIYLWSTNQPFGPGSGHIMANVIPAGTGELSAHRFVAPASVNGPYGRGVRLGTFIGFLPTDGTVAVNGVRVGFKHAALRPVLLDTPVHAYDSRSHSPLHGGSSRTVSLHNWTPSGALGAIVNVSVLNTHSGGALLLGATFSSATTAVARWARSGDRQSNSVTTRISFDRTVVVKSASGSGATDFTVDVVGYLV